MSWYSLQPHLWAPVVRLCSSLYALGFFTTRETLQVSTRVNVPSFLSLKKKEDEKSPPPARVQWAVSQSAVQRVQPRVFPLKPAACIREKSSRAQGSNASKLIIIIKKNLTADFYNCIIRQMSVSAFLHFQISIISKIRVLSAYGSNRTMIRTCYLCADTIYQRCKVMHWWALILGIRFHASEYLQSSGEAA